MSNLKELKSFIKEYERATNSHDFDQVKPLIAKDALYWFSEGTFKGIKAIEKIFVQTWNKVKEEKYHIKNVKWLMTDNKYGVCVYDFFWQGKVNEKLKQGHGRGTNFFVKKGKKWQIGHEHLSVVR